jgi:hypothetical protein
MKAHGVVGPDEVLASCKLAGAGSDGSIRSTRLATDTAPESDPRIQARIAVQAQILFACPPYKRDMRAALVIIVLTGLVRADLGVMPQLKYFHAGRTQRLFDDGTIPVPRGRAREIIDGVFAEAGIIMHRSSLTLRFSRAVEQRAHARRCLPSRYCCYPVALLDKPIVIDGFEPVSGLAYVFMDVGEDRYGELSNPSLSLPYSWADLAAAAHQLRILTANTLPAPVKRLVVFYDPRPMSRVEAESLLGDEVRAVLAGRAP